MAKIWGVCVSNTLTIGVVCSASAICVKFALKKCVMRCNSSVTLLDILKDHFMTLVDVLFYTSFSYIYVYRSWLNREMMIVDTNWHPHDLMSHSGGNYFKDDQGSSRLYILCNLLSWPTGEPKPKTYYFHSVSDLRWEQICGKSASI